METHKLPCSFSIDLDNLWAYLKTHGDAQWVNFPSYLDTFLPEFLDLLDELQISITFFIVGQDAALQKNQDLLREIVRRGHEVANHSFHHEPNLNRCSKAQLKGELLAADEAIFRVTGQKPLGFRGPGFTWNSHLLELLTEHGYQYNSTIFPTFIGPLARLYYNLKAPSAEKKSDNLFGSFKNGFLPSSPYLWDIPDHPQLLELPITTIPLLKLPFHMSYLLFLNSLSPAFMRGYLAVAVRSCLLAGIAPNFLLHPTDILGGDRVPEMAFFPGMNLPTSIKKQVFIEVINKLKSHFKPVNMSESVALLIRNKESLKTKRTVAYD